MNVIPGLDAVGFRSDPGGQRSAALAQLSPELLPCPLLLPLSLCASLRSPSDRLLHCLTMMASRFARRVASQSFRSASRVSARPAAPAARRFATTDAAHGAKESSDTPWMVRPSYAPPKAFVDPCSAF